MAIFDARRYKIAPLQKRRKTMGNPTLICTGSMTKVELSLGIIGPGLIGKALLGQISQQAPILAQSNNIILTVVGISNSKKMLLSDGPSALATAPGSWEAPLAASSIPVDLDRLASHVKTAAQASRGHPVLVDNTASEEVAAKYLGWLREGISVVTPNKRFATGPMGRYLEARGIVREGPGMFFYEATVGAGLPVMSTLKTLLATGDKVTSIQGILSGTLSFLFNSYDPSVKPWSQLVAEAREAGYTEPDPRDDLSGADVARKVVILARECGLQVEMSDLDVESLVPEPLRSVSLDDFMRRLPEFDAAMSDRAAAAAAAGAVLRYVGTVDAASGTVRVELKSFPKAHAFAGMQGTDNIVQFATLRYSRNNLIVRGPGAGAEVTAGGIFGDLLQAALSKGAAPL